MVQKKIPSFDNYYMNIAQVVSTRANCLGKKVGAIIVVENRIVATGYNGVPDGMTNCLDGGCSVCNDKNEYRKKIKNKRKEKRSGSGKYYDDCICVHAEQNALMTCVRVGISIDGGYVYSTYQPCFGCLKQLLQANIKKIVYANDWLSSDRRLRKTRYEEIQNEFEEGVWKFKSSDKVEKLSKDRLK